MTDKEKIVILVKTCKWANAEINRLRQELAGGPAYINEPIQKALKLVGEK